MNYQIRCQYLLSFNHPGGFLAFLAAEGLVWAAFSAVLFPIGYWVGEQLGNATLGVKKRRPLFYYTAVAALVMSCWAASALAIAAGL